MLLLSQKSRKQTVKVRQSFGHRETYLDQVLNLNDYRNVSSLFLLIGDVMFRNLNREDVVLVEITRQSNI